jgi:BlaI family transcriptional regulator, penicillinase repressor
MPRLPSSVPTEVELAILRVLWDRGAATVRQIHDALKHERGTGYSTTLKMIQVMTEKGLVRKDESQRPQVYTPALQQEQTQLQLVDDLIQKGFGGSAMKLVLRAASAKRISPDELTEIRKLIEKAKGEKR